MHILCDKQALIDAVGNVQRGVSGKSTLPALEGILLRATGSSLFLAGYDLEMGITKTIEAQVNEPGEIVLTAGCSVTSSAGCLARMSPLSSDDKYNTLIRSGMTEFTIMGISAGEYPELPSVSDGVGAHPSAESAPVDDPANSLCRRPDRCPAGSYRCPV